MAEPQSSKLAVRVRFPSAAPDTETMPRPSAPRTARPLLAFAAALFAGGVALAVAQPGDLGEDDDEDASASATTTSSTPADTSSTATSDAVSVTTATTAGSATTGTTAGSATTGTTAGSATTGTTAPGSGLGSSGGSRADDGTAETGMESLLGPGLGLAAIAAVLRGAGRRR